MSNDDYKIGDTVIAKITIEPYLAEGTTYTIYGVAMDNLHGIMYSINPEDAFWYWKEFSNKISNL